jgi:transcriptional regulator with XRE-family HTH domain
MERTADRLREARRRGGYPSPDDFADRLEIDRATYRGYEQGTRQLSPQLGYRFAQLLGTDWIDLLYGEEYSHEGVEHGRRGGPLRRGAEPAATDTAPLTLERPMPQLAMRLPSAIAEATGVMVADAPSAIDPAPIFARTLRLTARDAIAIDELDIQLAGGAGISRASQHPLAEWSLPRAALRAGAKAAEASLKMLKIAGDEMEPTFRAGDHVLIDSADTRPTAPGIFVIWDGMALVFRRLEMIAGSEPAALRIAADNPKYPPAERRLAETLIQGRVIGKWSWV